uniref:MCM domain-containing protein 2 n=1 Tax=Cacopsylla melanoneura TaxID=428564 RepID=A0A8D8T562_9HEMI
MPFILDFVSEQEAEDYSSFVLNKTLQNGHELEDEFISRDDFKQYLEMAKTIQVEVDPSSKQVISNYFVATRRSRPECSLPITGISKLTALAESHARLRLSPTVTYEDAIAVIRLYEQSMSYVHGKSICTTVCPQMEMDFEKPAQIHDTMLRFSLWLDKYIKTYIRDHSMTSRDSSMGFY